MKCYTTEELKDLLNEAYLKGFSASGEGYNGEYPFDQYGDSPEDDKEWQEKRDECIADLLHRDTGGYDGKGNKA